MAAFVPDVVESAMNVALRRPMSRDEFLAWVERQEGRWEFDGIQPVAMTGGSLGHSVITGNLIRTLGNRLAGKPCRPIGPDAAVATVGNAVRYPDVVVTCSPFRPGDYLVPDPVIVFEVVSPTSVRNDRVTKLREYAAVSSIRRFVLVESEAVAVTVFHRDGGDEAFRATGFTEDDVLTLPEIGTELPVSAVYDGVLAPPADPAT